MHTKNSATSALIVLLSFASIFAVLVALFPAGFERGLSFLFVLIFSRQSGLMMLGIALLLLVVSVQWWQILNLQRINTLPLSEVERLHPKLPASLEIVMTVLLSTALIIFFVQLASIAHSVLLTVTLASRVAETNEPRDLIISDFDADGDLDYITGNLKRAGENHNVYRNSGTGAYTRVQQIDASTNFIAFDGGDLDGDGDTDFLQTTKTSLSVYLGSGTGSFNAGPAVTMDSYSAPNTFTDIALGDVDSDGDLDAIAAGKGTMTGKSLFLNNGKAVFTQTLSVLGSSSAVTLLDVNADDYLDIAAVSTIGRLTVYRNLGTGSFLQVFSAANVTLLPVLAHGDIDGDGDIDILSANTSQQVVAWRAGGTGSFTALTGVASLVSNVKAIALGDIDNDGDLDMIVAGLTNGEFDGGAQLLYNDGNGVFSIPGITMVSGLDNTRAVAIGDIDSDSDLDWILANSGATKNGHYKTNQSTIVANTVPIAPTSLSSAIVSPSAITGATIADTAGTGSIAWSNATNAGRSDDVYATAALASGERAKYLQATGYNFEIPSSATVQGIVVTIERKASTGSLFDGAVRVVKAGSVVGTNQPSATAWATTDSSVSYGSSTDVWGTTWTPAEINSGAFGAALSVVNSSDEAVTASVDNITITVYTNLYDVRLTWGSGSDSQTVARLLQYQPRVGTGSATDNILSGRVSGSEYATRIMSNGKSRTYLLKNLACGYTYHWSVRSRDQQLAPSSASAASAFTLNAGCSFAEASSLTVQTGGGLPWSFFLGGEPKKAERRMKVVEETDEAIVGNSKVTLEVFMDLNADAVRQNFTERLIGDVLVRIEEVSSDDILVAAQTSLLPPLEVALGPDGTAIVSMPKGQYNITVLDPRERLRSYIPTSDSPTVVVVDSDSRYLVGLGFRQDSLGYAPCMRISESKQTEEKDPAITFLSLLRDLHGTPLMQGIDGTAPLMTRGAFVHLLQRILCIPLEKNQQKDAKLFADADLLDAATLQVFTSLWKAGIPVGKQIDGNLFADSKGFIAREDVIRMLAQVPSFADIDTEAVTALLPVDVPESSTLAPAFLRLASLNILPKQFFPILRGHAGVTLGDAAFILANAAFVSGTISLEPESKPAEQKPIPTFLLSLQFRLQQPIACLEEGKDRTRSVLFSDVPPGHPFYGALTNLLGYRMKNIDGKDVWMLPLTGEQSEFGISSGEGISAALDEPVSASEILHALLGLLCKVPLTAYQMGHGGYPIQQGTAIPYPTDKYFGLAPGSLSLDYRIAAASLHPGTEFNLSLFSYATSLLGKEDVYPNGFLSLTHFARLAASAVLNIEVKQGVLSPTEATGQINTVEFQILQDLSGQAGIPLAQASSIAVTWGNLYYFLSVVTGGLMEFPANAQSIVEPSLGEVWRGIFRP